jgi:proline iminopeptidase
MNIVTSTNRLYPEIEPYATHSFPVGNGQVLYVEESGNPNGLPIIFLHGGPGGSCKPYHRSLFNPEIYRIVLFDQRGAGRSTPAGILENNTTWDLVKDLEFLRNRLGISNWAVFGGSWGATLGLLYAQQHPDVVSGLVLRSIFLARERDIHWSYRDGGVNRFFPKQWKAFMRFMPKEGHWDNPLAIYHEYLRGTDDTLAKQAALAWAAWGGCVVSFGQLSPPVECTQELLNEARLECHYVFHHCFLEENQLLQNVNKVDNIPAILVHGQCDLMCPLESSYWVEKDWPAAQLRVLPTCGHLTSEPEMLSALVEATDDLAKLLC